MAAAVVGCSLHGGMSIHAHKPPTIGDRRAQTTPSPQCNSWRHPFSGGQKHTAQQSRYTCEHGTKQTHPLSNTTHASRTCCCCCCYPACDSLHLLYTAATPQCWTGPANLSNHKCSAPSKTESCTTTLHQLPKDRLLPDCGQHSSQQPRWSRFSVCTVDARTPCIRGSKLFGR
jgi:hypothetical protein